MKHTYGKWVVKKWEGEQWPDKRWSVGVDEQNGKAICISPKYDFETEESEANAKLIAAAPDLLEALQALVSWSAHLPPAANPEIEKAEAAIKKATE